MNQQATISSGWAEGARKPELKSLCFSSYENWTTLDGQPEKQLNEESETMSCDKTFLSTTYV